ncbi:Alpha/beta-hydrolase [Tolypocladium paradoxum]|uniref:Alpha/beta-hydrolase n=1 Tax=Tolypocladium paradoxum TaxID=94208 RepID=A0A2S4KMF7_9HYPO|nr:Alpha/beta-hydrolase [Tolypocladium paradoxum]
MTFYDSSGNSFVRHPNGQVTHYILDDFTDPWDKGEVILLQHGFSRTAQHWYHWVPRLARKYRVIRRDLRGHGLSSFPTSSSSTAGEYDYSLNTILEEIVDLLDQLGIDKVHFLGESTSGMLGIALTAKYPHRLHSLVICSSPTYLPQQALNSFAFGLPSFPEALRTLGSRGWAEAMSNSKGTVTSFVPGYVTWWIDQVAVSNSEGLAGYADFLSKLDVRPFISAVKLPMFILAPMNSAVIQVADMELLVSQIEGAKMEVIDAPGHEIYTSGAEKCQTSALGFWQSLKVAE